MKRITVPAVMLVFGAAYSLPAQTLAVMPTPLPGVTADLQRPPSEKSPALAAILSWFLYPGIGSYYAGASSHGTRHVLIATAALGGTIALLVNCDGDGYCDFDHDAARLSFAVGLGTVYVGNAIWSIVTAINDAEDFNYQLRAGPVHVEPRVVGLSSPAGTPARAGISLVSLRR